MVFALFFASSSLMAQKVNWGDQFPEVDRHVRDISHQMMYHPELIADALTKPFTSDIDKARALFAWIATNIEYNYTAFKNGIELTQNVNEVLNSGKAMCFGFSLLFQDLGLKAGLECVIIEGYAKGLGYEKGQKFRKPNHAWNAVKIAGQWYLMDVTWAAGPPRELMRNQRAVDLVNFFMADPADFIRTHLPEDPTWQLLDKKQTLEEFESGEKVEGANSVINAYSPDDYEGVDTFEKDIMQFKRSLDFNPDNINFTERLSFAYIYKGISLTEGLRKQPYEYLSMHADSLKNTFEAYMDSAWSLVEPIPLIRIQKSKGNIADEINYQRGVFNYEMGAELFRKGYNKKAPLPEVFKASNPFFDQAKQHFHAVSSKSIYGGDAQDYLRIIDRYESRMNSP